LGFHLTEDFAYRQISLPFVVALGTLDYVERGGGFSS
jgi:hypothetical protein